MNNGEYLGFKLTVLTIFQLSVLSCGQREHDDYAHFFAIRIRFLFIIKFRIRGLKNADMDDLGIYIIQIENRKKKKIASKTE